MDNEFNLNTVYVKTMSKEELIRILENSYDEEFIVTFLPRSKENADILIRSLTEEIQVEEESDNVGDIVEENNIIECICNECGGIFEDTYTDINELNKRIWCNNCVKEMCI